MKKGFTLIELLAVIVILGIVTLITTPIILNVIEDSRKNSAIGSAVGYLKSLEEAMVTEELLSGKTIERERIYKVEENTEYEYSELEYLNEHSDFNKEASNIYLNNVVNIKGTKPTDGYIIIGKQDVEEAELVINGYSIYCDNSRRCVVTGKFTSSSNVTSIKIEKPDSYSIVVGNTLELKASVETIDGSESVVSWTSSDTSVATINNKGVITGIKEGQVTIIAKSGNKKSRITVTIIYDEYIPTITKISNRGSSITLEYKIDNNDFITSYKCYYDQSVNFESTQFQSSTVNSCELTTQADTTYYYKVCAIDSSNNEHCSTVDNISTFNGIPVGNYEKGAAINYAGADWKVISDNGDSTTMVLASSYKSGAYGGTSWETSDIKKILNSDFIKEYPDLEKDVTNSAIIFDNTSSSYVRIPTKDEVSTEISNDNGLPFWLMDVSESLAAYATGSGNLSYTTYTKGSKVVGYNGYGSSLESISSLHDSISNRSTCTNVSTATNSNLYAPLSSTSVVTSQNCIRNTNIENPASTFAYNGTLGYATKTLNANYYAYVIYFTNFYVNDSTIKKYLCLCNFSTTEASCKTQTESKFSITCDNVKLGDGVNPLTIYYAKAGYYAANNVNTIENSYQNITIRPVITVRER